MEGAYAISEDVTVSHNFVPFASAGYFMDWVTTWHTHGIFVGFPQFHSSVKHIEEISMWIISEIWLFLNRTAECCTSLAIWITEDKKKVRGLYLMLFCVELCLCFWDDVSEMLSVFSCNVSRDEVHSCDILPGRKPHIQKHAIPKQVLGEWRTACCSTWLGSWTSKEHECAQSIMTGILESWGSY